MTLRPILTCLLGGLAAAAVAAPAMAAQAQAPCPVGAYRMAGGGVVDIADTDGGLRWRRFSGETGKLTPAPDGGWTGTAGWSDRPDGVRAAFGPCASGTLTLAGERGRRIPLQVRNASFVSHGAKLSGRLILPPGAGRVPIVVLLQGSEHSSALDFDPLQRLLPAAGVGAFVYDKRGTGASQGTYTQDFQLLADDAVAALAEARRLAGSRAGRIGFQGPSQGGWVAPIAATRSDPDFVIVCFGLAVSVIEEDQEAVELQMRLKGYGPEVIAKAKDVAAAAEALFESGFTEGLEQFDAVRARYRDEPWFKDVRGDYSFIILNMSDDEIRKAPFRFATPFRYDPRATIAAVKAPQLWILGGLDLEAPSGETARRLKAMIADGRPITLALYPKDEHGMTEFVTGPDGERVSTRYSPGYFRMMADFARDGRLHPPYGDAQITSPR